MSELRNKLIRLAHTNKELRADLLPLIKQADLKSTTGLVLKALEEYSMMFVVSLLRKHRDRKQEYTDLILSIKHDNPMLYQTIKAAWGRKLRNMLGADTQTMWMRDFMKMFRKHMEGFMQYVTTQAAPEDRASLVEVISALINDPRWLLRTVEQGFDKALKIANAL